MKEESDVIFLNEINLNIWVPIIREGKDHALFWSVYKWQIWLFCFIIIIINIIINQMLSKMTCRM